MQAISKHVSRCFLAGIVALLPIGGFVLMVVYLEATIAGSWLARQAWYFPGLGLLATAASIYLIGLTVSTFLGRWAWKKVDLLFDSLPALGRLYQTLKQIIGYGEGKDAIFQRVVLIRGSEPETSELGLVTNETADAAGARRLIVFVPGAPNPTVGRLVVIDSERTIALSVSVSDALKTLLSVGKTPLSLSPAALNARSSTASSTGTL
ncbi:MAG TPA: DUF502 domain-containing protein [Planctomycetaceae bacterium]|nr:DUF502 domain-containing protein [Planctomycetaceae bacterium]